MYEQTMLPIEKELKKPIIKNFIRENRKVAGFLRENGIFEEEREIRRESDIDDFMDKYGISVMMISLVE